jgi:hypothetical protein
MKSLILALLALGLGIASVQGQSFYNHNGSIMRLVQQGNAVRIFYEEPREGLRRNGVVTGTLLFEGQLDANLYLEGMSRIFSARCGELDYFVYGQFRRNGDFTLAGAAPVLERNGCRVIDNTYEGNNANLRFSWLRNAQAGQPASDGNARPVEPAHGAGPFCIVGVNSALNLRAGPGTTYAVVGTLAANSCDIGGYNRCEGDWCFVARGNDLGWVANQYLRQQR